MKLLILLFAFAPLFVYSQENSFTFQGEEYIAKMEVTDNAFGTNDTLLVFFKNGNENRMPDLLLQTYSEEEADGYRYWSRETLTIEEDAIIVLTYNYQTERLDWLPEWEKNVYRINDSGNLSISEEEQRVKPFGSDDWITEEALYFGVDSE
ncbi:MAG: hypothetical protein ACFHU9_09760 [Fluviicola sp.]